MLFAEIAALSPWKPEGAEEIAHLVSDRLDLCEKHTTIGTTELLAQLGWTHAMGRNIFTHLGNARKQGLLAGYFTLGKPTYGTFGKPSVRWHAPAARKPMTNAERLARIRQEDEAERTDSSAVAGRSAEELEELDNEPCETDTLEGAERAFAEAARLRAQTKLENEQ